MPETILVLNTGSSSLKFELFEIGPSDTLIRRLAGRLEGIGAQPHLLIMGRNGAVLHEERHPAERIPDIAAAQDVLNACLAAHITAPPAAVGHRVVHGGPEHAEPVVIDDTVLVFLERLIPLAPLHQPNNLAPIHAIRRQWPDLLQVACFDTAFHRHHPELADRFAIPEELYREGVRRYGFHGLSYEYIARRLPELAPKMAQARVVAAHLGAGCSMCAMIGGRSIESTMGFTALDGLPMGTRPGQLDAGVVLYLLAQKGMSPEQVERLLYHECGLKALSGISSDVRDLLASPDRRAGLALDYLTYRIALATGALAAAMDGLDGFVFTAGIGENSPVIREAVARRLCWLGLELDPDANACHGPLISKPGARVAVYVIPTEEELMIARHTLRILRASGAWRPGDR